MSGKVYPIKEAIVTIDPKRSDDEFVLPNGSTDISPGQTVMRRPRMVEVPGLTEEERDAIEARGKLEPVQLALVRRSAYERACEETLADLKEAKAGRLELDDVWLHATIEDLKEALEWPERYLSKPRARR